MQLWPAGSSFGRQNTLLPNTAFVLRPFVEHLSRACGTILSFRAASLILELIHCSTSVRLHSRIMHYSRRESFANEPSFRIFFRARFRAKACFTRRLSPGFK